MPTEFAVLLAAAENFEKLRNFFGGGGFQATLNVIGEVSQDAARLALAKAPVANDPRTQIAAAAQHLDTAISAYRKSYGNDQWMKLSLRPDLYFQSACRAFWASCLQALCYRFNKEYGLMKVSLEIASSAWMCALNVAPGWSQDLYIYANPDSEKYPKSPLPEPLKNFDKYLSALLDVIMEKKPHYRRSGNWLVRVTGFDEGIDELAKFSGIYPLLLRFAVFDKCSVYKLSPSDVQNFFSLMLSETHAVSGGVVDLLRPPQM